MAIVVLVLWLFTAGAGFYLLVTSNLGHARPAATTTAAEPGAAAAAPAAEPATASVAAPAAQAANAQQPTPVPPASKQERREQRQAARRRFDPPSLTAAKNAPAVPGLGALLEFAHPVSAIIGLGFWLGFTFIHYRALGWIAFGLVAVTVCLGLSWFAANTRAARRQAGAPYQATDNATDEPRPSFSTRLIVLHGGAATVTFTLAALTALVLGG
jgi:hypothetical protein